MTDSIDFNNSIVGQDLSYRADYQAPSSVSTFHNMQRVGGGTNDILVLYEEGDVNEIQSYAVGLLFATIFLIVLFSLWGIALCVFKCCTPRKLKPLDGNAFEENTRVLKIFRWIYGFSCLFVFLFSILLVTQGTLQLNNAVDTAGNSNQELLQITRDLTGTLSTLRTDGNQAIGYRDDLTKFISSNVCPLGMGTAIGDEIVSAANNAFVDTTELDNFVEGDLASLQTAIDDIQEYLETVDDGVEQSPSSAIYAVILAPYLTVTFGMGLALYIGWRGIRNKTFNCIFYLFVLPFFIWLIILAVVFACVATMMAAANADVCSGGSEGTPDATIEAILKDALTEDSIESDIAFFYIEQCRADNPLAYLDEYKEQLASAGTSIDDFVRLIEEYTVETLGLVCGRNFGPTLQNSKELSAALSALIANTARGINLIGCPRIVPIYRSLVHDSGCTISIKALTWIFAASFLIAFFGFVMLTTRAAYQPIGARGLDAHEEDAQAAPLGEDEDEHVPLEGDVEETPRGEVHVNEPKDVQNDSSFDEDKLVVEHVDSAEEGTGNSTMSSELST